MHLGSAFRVLTVSLVAAFGGHVARRSAASVDTQATGRYIRAAYVEVGREASKFGAAENAVNALVDKVEHDCSGVLADAPQGAGRQALAQESSGAALAALSTPFAREERKHARVIAYLRWKQPTLARLVATEARTELAEASFVPPPLCNNAHAWVSSGYSRVPDSTIRFDRNFAHLANAPEPTARIRRLIAPYENAHDSEVLRRVGRLEKKLEPETLHAWLTGASNLMRALGI